MNRAALGALLALALLAPVAAATDGAEGAEVQTLGPGQVHLPEALFVGPDTTLRLRPGTTLHGPGHIEVHGVLEVDGAEDARVVLRVPLVLVGERASHLRNTTVEAIGGAAVTVRNGSLTVENSTFRENHVGLVVTGATQLVDVRTSTFHAHASAAARIDAVSYARFGNVTMQDNPIGLLARLDSDTPLRIEVDRSRFEDNPDHVRLDFGATPNAGADVRIRNATFRAGALAILSDLSSAPTTPEPPRVLLESNRISGSEVGMTARGVGYRIVSVGDTFENNRIAISAAGADLTLVDTRFSSLERDLDLDDAVRLALDGVVLSATDGPPPPSGSSGPWAFVLGALLAGGGAVAFWRRRRATSEGLAAPVGAGEGADFRTDAAAADYAGLPPQATVVSLARREWTEIEARVLHDIHAHPGTPQTDVARRLGLSRQALHYHVKKLVDAGAVQKTPNGRTTECRVAPGLRLPPLPPAVTQQGALEKG